MWPGYAGLGLLMLFAIEEKNFRDILKVMGAFFLLLVCMCVYFASPESGEECNAQQEHKESVLIQFRYPTRKSPGTFENKDLTSIFKHSLSF